MYSHELLQFLQQNDFKNHSSSRNDKKYPIDVAIELEHETLVNELLTLGVHLNPKALSSGLNSKQPKIVELVYQHIYPKLEKSHAKFFNICRNLSPSVHEKGREFQQAMENNYKNDESVNVLGLSKRGVIAARSYPYQLTLMKIDGIEKLVYSNEKSKKIIPEISNWYNGGYNEKKIANLNWARLNIENSQGKKVAIQINPSYSQLANFRQLNIGEYSLNGRKAILDLLYQLTAQFDKKNQQWISNQENEKKLAAIMLASCRQGQPITAQQLHHNQLPHSASTIVQLNEFMHLLTVEEVQRRLYPGVLKLKENNRIQNPLPMGIAIAMGLMLIEAGHLSFKLFFDKDCSDNIGPFIHDLIISEEGILIYHQKMQKLLGLFVKHFPSISITQEEMHQLMLETFGGEDESDGENYDSDFEDENQDHDVKEFIKKNQHKSLYKAIKNNKSYHFIEKLIQKGVPLNTLDSQSQTALHLAVEKDRVNVVQLLLKYGANENLNNHQSLTPLAMAVKKNHSIISHLLTNDKSYFTNYRNSTFQTLLHEAIQNDADVDYIKSLILEDKVDIDAIDEKGNTALHYAVIEEKKEVVSFLLEMNASFLVKNKLGRTADYYAEDSIDDILTSHIDNIPIYSDKIKAQEIDKFGQTGLHRAVNDGDFSSFIYYINQNVALDVQDFKGCTALHYAVMNHLLDFAMYLLNNHANVDILDFNKKTAFYYAVKNNYKDLVTLLWRHTPTLDWSVRKLIQENKEEEAFYENLLNLV